MSHANAVALLAEALHVDPAEVTGDAMLGVTPQWDSLAHTRLILVLEAALGRLLTPQEIVGMASLQDIAVVLDAA